MDMEILTNQELSTLKGGKWVMINGKWVWLMKTDKNYKSINAHK